MKPVFSKFNRTRNLPFQIVTTICFGDRNFVAKRALTIEATTHVRNIFDCYDLLMQTFDESALKIPKVLNVFEDEIQFEYLEGKFLSYDLEEAVIRRNKTGVILTFDNLRSLIFDKTASANNLVEKDLSSFIYESVDLSVIARQKHFFKVTNIDILPQNIIISGGCNYLIDNEWVFPIAMPKNFIVFRALLIFFNFGLDLGGLNLCFGELLERYNISDDEAIAYRQMEDNFQRHVYGEMPRRFDFKWRYKRKAIDPFLSYRRYEEVLTAFAARRGIKLPDENIVKENMSLEAIHGDLVRFIMDSMNSESSD